jgi:hypothetical protein
LAVPVEANTGIATGDVTNPRHVSAGKRVGKQANRRKIFSVGLLITRLLQVTNWEKENARSNAAVAALRTSGRWCGRPVSPKGEKSSLSSS